MTVTEPESPTEGDAPRRKGLPSFGPPTFDRDTGLRTRYVPIPPHAKQAAFLATNDRELFYGGAGGGGKRLATWTLVATPAGFTPIGDLHPGDPVFGADGDIHTVVGESDVTVEPGWRLTFDNGETIVAHDDHYWCTRTLDDPAVVVRTTSDIVETLHTGDGEPNHAIPVADPLRYPSDIDDDLEHFYDFGAGIDGDSPIPTQYMRGGVAQRQLLLAGLVAAATHPQERAHLTRTLGTKAVVHPDGRVLQSTHGYHYITGAERVDPVPMKCIQTSAPNGMYLVGHHMIPTHNSWALLAAALQFVDVPGYAALIIRRRLTDLTMNGALISMSHDWLDNTDAKWNGNDRKWTFPSGAVLQFGYLDHPQDAARYRGVEVHYVGFDELGEIPLEESYTFLFSRLRRPAGLSREQIIAMYGEAPDGTTLLDIPLRVRGASNPGGPGCVPYGDVLTPTGWVPIQDMQVGDPLFTVTADGSLATSKVEQTHRYDWAGDLAVVDARGLHVAVTPNHRMAKVGGVRAGRWTRDGEPPTRFSLVRFDELPGQATLLRSVTWVGTPLGQVRPDDPTIPQRRLRLPQPESLPGESYCRLLGWYLAEGSKVDRDKAFDITQVKPDGRAEVRRLLEEECGFTVCWSARRARVHSARWWEHFRQFGHYSYLKFVPAVVKEATVPELRALLEGLMAGDGTWSGTLGDKGCGTFYTSSGQLASDVVEIALKCGYIVSHRTRDRRGATVIQGRDVSTNHIAHEVNIKPATKSGGTEILTGQHRYNVATTSKRRSDVKAVPYTGPVYCLTVPDTHTFIVRQKGSVWVSGNSVWVKERFIDGPIPFIPSTYRDNPAIDDDEYEESLAKLSEIERRRMGDGDWEVQEIPGALWKLADIDRDEWTVDDVLPDPDDGPDYIKERVWRIDDGVERFDRTLMALDPSVGEGAGDECGITIGGQEAGGRLVVLADLSGASHPDVWSATAVTNYHLYGCSVLVAEKNQGGELLRTQINSAADKLGLDRPNIRLRSAIGSKEARAAVAQQAYTSKPPMVVHHRDLQGGKLEAQQVGWVPGAPKAVSSVKSPDRVDSLAWLVREALYPEGKESAKPTSTTKKKLSSW